MKSFLRLLWWEFDKHESSERKATEKPQNIPESHKVAINNNDKGDDKLNRHASHQQKGKGQGQGSSFI